MKIDGCIYKLNSIDSIPAFLHVDKSTYTLYANNQQLKTGTLDSLNIPARVGNTTRKIDISDIGLFETSDNDAIDQAFIKGKSNKNWAYLLESKFRYAIPAVLLTIVLTAAYFIWGVPYTAEKIAYALPESVNEKIAQGSFEAIDQSMLSPSQLPEEKKQLITKRFNQLVNDFGNNDFNYRLHFRSMSNEPNAFAFPDGNIVVTDKLVKLAGDKTDEVVSVLLHEIGHVEHRHGLRLAIEASSVAVVFAMMTGDIAASDELLITLPTLLSTSAYSRKHETEADHYALKHMKKANLDPIHFARIMAKITRTNYKEGSQKSNNPANEGQSDTTESRVEKAFNYISSHPVTLERIQKAEQASVEFNQAIE